MTTRTHEGTARPSCVGVGEGTDTPGGVEAGTASPASAPGVSDWEQELSGNRDETEDEYWQRVMDEQRENARRELERDPMRCPDCGAILRVRRDCSGPYKWCWSCRWIVSRDVEEDDDYGPIGQWRER